MDPAHWLCRELFYRGRPVIGHVRGVGHADADGEVYKGEAVPVVPSSYFFSTSLTTALFDRSDPACTSPAQPVTRPPPPLQVITSLSDTITAMLSFTHLALLPLALTSLPLALASPASPISAPATVPAAAAEHDSTLASRTFGWSSGGHHQSIWDKGGWWSQNDCRDAAKSAICFSRGFGWGCNSQCICIQPPNHDGCKDEGRWKHCQSKGHGWGCSKSCECVPPPSDEPECKSSLVESCSRQGKGASESLR